jgi:hypothetical protein
MKEQMVRREAADGLSAQVYVFTYFSEACPACPLGHALKLTAYTREERRSTRAKFREVEAWHHNRRSKQVVERDTPTVPPDVIEEARTVFCQTLAVLG